MSITSLPLIDEGAISKLGLGCGDYTEALQSAFVAAARGEISWRPKASVSEPTGAWMIGTLGCWGAKNLAIFHNIAGTSPKPGHTGPHYRSFQLLTNYETTEALALVDGTTGSNWLPACVTLLTARSFALPESSSVTFIGAGLQARVNLQALAGAFPLRQVHVVSRTQQSAEGFARFARETFGLSAVVAASAREAVAAADIVVSSVPSGSGAAFLEPSWVKPGAFVSAVDLGRSWRQGFQEFERVICDDRAQAIAQVRDGRLPHVLEYDTELTELVTQSRPGRAGRNERVVAIHPGNLVGILGITDLIYRTWTAARPNLSANEG
jgi:alanine dehydrogenase